ncbi:MAG: SsrA-binding protein [Candidatus Yanofskybacteria bacterium RIFCSPLOWO2_02_FULL_45_10]|uniref:SsrA-binding protein n=3 Tax=Parcubacteria group TaxID=1794811 RepID=A0A1F8G0W0_9BACT|nr:MAG: SsrA-binding protein [Candidatus Nomurabacteria bacterium GW2011_GWB1_47_6]OGN18967.1 MAG: SsrA-binding protein [Candidatus Yanofskybacteria bacterium RIFCSPHIGHO2_12_FULL_45_19b]OGN31535.1 MAG: SsrA-binding protein [Candidatus Yanofskybacteria bacterium RIFCSPLOWO2_02_FULL_45_10]
MTTFATNPRATFDYQILETIEAGLKLTGHEVKAVKAGKCSLRGSYVKTSGTDLILIGATISPYQPSNLPPDYEPDRSIQLLIKKSESKKLAQELETAGLTLVPLKLYSKNNLVKLEIGLARGKKKYDKRESIKKREFERKEKRGA